MSNIDKQALLKIAESVDREEWDVLDNGDDEYQVIVSGSLERGATYRSYRPVANEIPEREIAAFIAAANPSTVLVLLDELEKAQRQIVNFQQSCENDPRIHEIIDLKELIAELDKRLIEYAGIATREARRVAELEARTVSIPEVRITVAESKRKNLTWRELGAYNEGADVAKEKILAAIRAAGIKVIEGEGA
ncbi:TPA: ead/Ea22-like family protein [Salmonella enterica]|nr:ead/Ea22-like family protein [Salmonella enterica]MBH0603263.1 ead/Ea22-like family protein [Salmonella enterica]MBH0611885.1 ead/Ea22-like family protein [Salmonella enterica]